jgi:opacity protein-like surface antigen
MRSVLLGVASVGALLAATQANAQTMGYVDLSFGQINVEDIDLDAISLGGAAAFDLSGSWRVQFDVEANRLSEDDSTVTVTNTTAHVYHQSENWAIGGVLSNRDFVAGTSWSIGLEMQKHLGPVVLEGEVGIGTLEFIDPIIGDDSGVVNADASATWYVTNDFSIAAGVSYLDIDELDNSLVGYGVDLEYKFSGSNFSAFGGYSTLDEDDVDVDTWRIGLRYAFGDDALKGRRQTGPRWQASADTIPLL